MENVAANGRRSAGPVEDELFDKPYRYEFYQAVRLLEAIYCGEGAPGAAGDPPRARVGEHNDPSQEVVRFRSHVSMAFPPSEIRSLSWPAPADGSHGGSANAGSAPTMSVNFMGLAGCTGPMPYVYTQVALRRRAGHDRAMIDFLDMFNHRLVSLMYRVRRDHHVGFEMRRPDRTRIARYLFSLIGLHGAGETTRVGLRPGNEQYGIGTDAIKEESEGPFDSSSNRMLLQYAGLLASRPRTMHGLETLIGHYFALPVNGRQLQGRWLELPREQRTMPGGRGRNRRLGGAILGGRVWDPMGGIELELGPMPYDTAIEFLPGGRLNGPLCRLTRTFAGSHLDVLYLFAIEAATIPHADLRRPSGLRLGRTAWVGRGASTSDGNVIRWRMPAATATE